MMLYKYVGFEAGQKILRSNSVGFTQPHNFNDPFEVSSYPIDSSMDPGLAAVKAAIIKRVWQERTAILSLTRSPLNPLMWAHYGQQHSGIVIGFDAADEFFTSRIRNCLPVQYGSVIYTESRPTWQLMGEQTEARIGQEYGYRPELLEKLQRLFLYKPACWAYEEEVRLVKCIGGIQDGACPSGKFTTLDVQGRDLFLLTLPVGVIREVYVGFRCALADEPQLSEFRKELADAHPAAKVFLCVPEDDTWGLQALQ